MSDLTVHEQWLIDEIYDAVVSNDFPTYTEFYEWVKENKDRLTVDCDKCEQRGKIFELSQESVCSHCKHHNRKWHEDYYEPIRGAE